MYHTTKGNRPQCLRRGQLLCSRLTGNLKIHFTDSAFTRHLLSIKTLASMVGCGYSVRPSANEKTMVATRPGRFALLFALSVSILAAGISEGSKGNTTFPVFVHRKIGSK